MGRNRRKGKKDRLRWCGGGVVQWWCGVVVVKWRGGGRCDWDFKGQVRKKKEGEGEGSASVDEYEYWNCNFQCNVYGHTMPIVGLLKIIMNFPLFTPLILYFLLNKLHVQEHVGTRRCAWHKRALKHSQKYYTNQRATWLENLFKVISKIWYKNNQNKMI